MINKFNDDLNINRLKQFHLPALYSIQQLLKVLNLSEQESKFFYSKNRKRNLYCSFFIYKDNGEKRKIDVPNKDILPILKAINRSIFSCFSFNKCCVGFLKGKSIVDNAAPHKGCKTLIKFDIKNFFPSITLKRIVYTLRYFGYGKNVSKYLGYLCVNDEFVLPQGAPTSPSLSNIVCNKLDSRIYGIIKTTFSNFDLVYTRYADDITISSTKRLSKSTVNFIHDRINSIIMSEGFQPNEDKFKFFYNGEKLLVTGVVVNQKSSLYPCKEIRREIENAIRYIKKYGINSHISYLYKTNKTTYSTNSYLEHIFGLSAFYKMINKEVGIKLHLQLIEAISVYGL